MTTLNRIDSYGAQNTPTSLKGETNELRLLRDSIVNISKFAISEFDIPVDPKFAHPNFHESIDQLQRAVVEQTDFFMVVFFKNDAANMLTFKLVPKR
jgi:hypothetical protein